MSNDFEIRNLGACTIESPVDSGICVKDDSGILYDVSANQHLGDDSFRDVLETAGPRRKIFFDPAVSKAAIVTCGGLCPGLNDVIRAITMVLWYRYGIREIFGLRYGYEGMISTIGHEPIMLTPDLVEDIHKDGGTILGSSRGPQDVPDSVDFLVENKINLLFTIGGDGTQRGLLDIANEIERRNLNIAAIGIPKTIDNDVSCTERTFGFETAVAMSQTSITCAHMEAKGARNGIGLVKLMGRESGFVAAHATLASSDVNLVLLPEISFSMEKVFSYLLERFEKKSHSVIVVAEGAGQDLMHTEGSDASGNKKLGDIGLFMKKALAEHFKSCGVEAHIKYIDPSYIIRSAPATADDSVFCFHLGQYAVHAGMTGRTAMVVGLWNGHFVHVPVAKAVAERKMIDSSGLLWQSILDNTGQPANLV
ncbi:MAG: ATP-dependent 6-phosphofructokinase [Kiritimatiellae bacterium]|nr:ATP-dependent 6-phosphofructokinase [Kiritimatiellia bacterium]